MRLKLKRNLRRGPVDQLDRQHDVGPPARTGNFWVKVPAPVPMVKGLLRPSLIEPILPNMSSPLGSGQSILRRETWGFSLLLLLVWVTEIAGVPHLLFGEPPAFV